MTAPAEPVTFLMVSRWLGDPQSQAAIQVDRSVLMIPGDFPGLLATLTAALAHAADALEPTRCEECLGEPQPCPECAGDPDLVRACRQLHEALTAAMRRREGDHLDH